MTFKQRLLEKKESDLEVELVTPYTVITGRIKDVDDDSIVLIQKTIRSSVPIEQVGLSEDKKSTVIEHIETEVTILIDDIKAMSIILKKTQM